MKEKDLWRAVERLLPKDVHRQGMTGASMTHNGLPDRYYDSPRAGDLWVEYKNLKSMPRSGVVVGALTELQLVWLTRRYNNSVYLARTPNVAVVIGLPNRSAVIQRNPTEWREGTHTSTALSFQEVAACLDSGLLSPKR